MFQDVASSINKFLDYPCFFYTTLFQIRILLMIVIDFQMKRYLFVLFLFLSLFPHTDCDKNIKLQLGRGVTVSLNRSKTASYTIIVPANITSNEDLYIHVHPTLTDPLQVPDLTVSSDKKYLQDCYNAHEDFAGICKIDSKQLTAGREFLLSIKCITDCTLDLQTYLSDIVSLPLGEQLQLNSFSDQGLTVSVLIEVPSTADYSVLALLATITNIELNTKFSDQKVDMLINYGDKNVSTPTDSEYMVQAHSLVTGGRGIYLQREKVKPGDWIKMYLKLQKGISVTVSASEITNGNYKVSLGRSYFDYIHEQQAKIYILNASDLSEDITNKTIELVFDIYSGEPLIAVALDRGFTNIVSLSRRSSAISFQFSPSLRKDYNFTGYIYIQISATIPSEYYFYSKVSRQNVTLIEPHLTYFDQIQQNAVQNYIMVQKYAFDKANSYTKVTYIFNIQVMEGAGSFYFKRCKDIERQEGNSEKDKDLNNCLISLASELKDHKFLEQQIQSQIALQGNMITISISYDIRDCSDLATKDSTESKECAFQLIAVGESVKPFSFSMTVQKQYYLTHLKENTMVKDYLSKKTYVYYALSLGSFTNTTEAQIFLITYSGESALIVSTTQKFPTLQSPPNQIKIETGQIITMVLNGSALSQWIYIGIYAYQFTEVSLGAVVREAEIPSEFSPADVPDNVILLKGTAMTYTLNPLKLMVYFMANSQNSDSIVISLNEIAGHSLFKVYDMENNQLKCIGKSDNPLVCQIDTAKYTFYRIAVIGDYGKTNKVAINYRDNIHDCTPGILNLPVNVVLHAAESQCFTFSFKRNIGLKFISSFTHAQLISQQIDVDFYANDAMLPPLQGNHYDMTVEQMSKGCSLSAKKPGFTKACLITVKFSSNSSSTENFNFVLEEEDAEIALLEGMVERIVDVDIQKGGKLFYYRFYNARAVKVFFTAHSLNLIYMMLAKVMDRETFLNRKADEGVNLHQDYLDTMNNQANTSNLLTTSLKSFGTSIVSIDQQFVRKNCPNGTDCYLLLKIIALSPQQFGAILQNFEQINYDLEVTQEQTYLPIGDTKVGFVAVGEVYTYLLDPEDAYITFRNMNSEGRRAPNCASIYTAVNGMVIQYTPVGGNIQVKKSDKTDRIFVRGDIDPCSYQISYTSASQPVQSVRLSTLYELDIQKGQTSGFLFYNKHPTSFRIMQMVSTGNAFIYILPFSQDNTTLKDAFSTNHTFFPMVDKVDGDFIVSSTSDYFCSDCFYYIVVTANSRFIGQIVFLRLADPIPLTANHMFRQSLKPQTDTSQQQYVYYSLTTFTITFNMISGRVFVKMTDPDSNSVINELVDETKTFKIEAVDYKSQEKFELYSNKALYRIIVTAQTEAEFYVRLDRTLATERIFEGYPVTVETVKDNPTIIQFVNSQLLDKPVTLMINLDGPAVTSVQDSIKVDILVHLDNGELMTHSQLISRVVNSENTIAYHFQNVVGIYYITVITDIARKVTVLLFKDQLTYLTPSADHLFSHQGIFQIHSDNQNVMVQIFNCRGDLSLVASNNYEDIANPAVANSSLISIKRPNYGGHYVFGVQNAPGSYFLKVNNKNPINELQYLINYYHYNRTNPYDSVDAANYDVNYVLGGQGIALSVNAPMLAEGSQDTFIISNISYWAYVSDSEEDVNQYSRCTMQSKKVGIFKSNTPSISIENSFVEQFLAENTESLNMFVIVEASIEIQVLDALNKEAEHFPKRLTIFYNTIYIPVKNVQSYVQLAYWFTNSLFVFIAWMALPFLIAAIVFIYLIKFCLRKFILSQSNMIEEIESKPTIQNTDEIRTDVKLAVPDYVIEAERKANNL